MSKYNILISSLLKYEASLQIHHINMNTCQKYMENKLKIELLKYYLNEIFQCFPVKKKK